MPRSLSRSVTTAACGVALLTLLAASIVSASSPVVEALLEQAREATAKDEHATAIAAYREAIAIEPALRDSVSLGLASQLTWSGDHAAAINEFRWLLRRQPRRVDAWKLLALAQAWSGHTRDALASYRRILDLNPNDTDAQFGEARMLAWLGRSTTAVHRYERLLAEHPEHRDARLGLAMLHNWRGDHELSASLFRPFTTNDPSLRDGWEGLAWAEHWNGRDDLALKTLEQQEQAGASSTAGKDLRAEIVSQWQRRVNSNFQFAEDSDHFQTESARLDFEIPVQYRGHLRLGALRENFSKRGSADVRDTWVVFGADWRMHQRWSASLNSQIQAERPKDADYFRGQEDLNLAWLGGDRVRVDVGYSHLALFTYEAHPQRLLGDLLVGGLSLRPEHRTTVILSGDYASYGDGNDRRNLRARGRYALFPRRPRTFIELGGQALDYSHQRTAGLWTPNDYRAAYGRVDFEVNPGRIVTFVGSADGGWAKEKPGDFTPYLAYSGALVWRPRPVRIEARAGHSDGNLDTGRGYRRTFVALDITAAF